MGSNEAEEDRTDAIARYVAAATHHLWRLFLGAVLMGFTAVVQPLAIVLSWFEIMPVECRTLVIACCALLQVCVTIDGGKHSRALTELRRSL